MLTFLDLLLLPLGLETRHLPHLLPLLPLPLHRHLNTKLLLPLRPKEKPLHLRKRRLRLREKRPRLRENSHLATAEPLLQPNQRPLRLRPKNPATLKLPRAPTHPPLKPVLGLKRPLPLTPLRLPTLRLLKLLKLGRPRPRS